MHKRCYFILLLLYLTTLLPMASANTTLLVPESDDRLYRVIRLENEMQVMLISDPTSEKVKSEYLYIKSCCFRFNNYQNRLVLLWMCTLVAFLILKKSPALHIFWVSTPTTGVNFKALIDRKYLLFIYVEFFLNFSVF